MRIAWIAAVQPPYREPMWSAIADQADLEVSFLFAKERVRHFRYRPSPDYSSSLVRSYRIPLPRAIARRFDEPPALLGPLVMRRVLAGADVLMIHIWWQPVNILTSVVARLRGIPYMIFAESTLESRRVERGLAARLRSAVFRNAGAVIVPGSDAAEAAIADGARPDRVVEAGNSVDFDMYVRRIEAIRERAEPANDISHRFLYLGQLIHRKNVAALVTAFAGLDEKSILDIVGDGVEMSTLVKLAREHGVADRVRFRGFLQPDQVLDVLGETHTLVLPSTEEVYGYTALEAYVAGLQVVVSDRAGVASTLVGRPGVWVVEPDVAALRAALAEAHSAWSGWRSAEDAEFASPHAAAREILRAVDIARSTMRRGR